MDPVSKLLRSTVLRDARLARAVFRFAMSHSSNALSPKAVKRQRDASVPAEWIFDWLADLNDDLSTPRLWKVRVSDGNLWVTKSFCINLAILTPAQPGLVKDVLAISTTSLNHDQVFKALHEMDLVGNLFYHIMHDESFATLPTFTSRKEFIRSLFQHGRKTKKPLMIMEHLYETTSYSWSMQFGKSGVFVDEPWKQTWREYADRFAPVQREIAVLATHAMTFRGQRHFAFDFFDRGEGSVRAFAFLNGKEDIDMDKALVKGAWIMGAGQNRHIRNKILRNGDWSGRRFTPWTSFIYPWADHALFEEGASPLEPHEGPSPRHAEGAPTRPAALNRSGVEGAEPLGLRPQALARLQRFCIVAAVADGAPELFDCPMHAWMQIETYEARLLESKPYLKHVIHKLATLTKECTPPAALAASLLDAAKAFVAEHSPQARFFSSSEFLEACEVRDLDFVSISQQLQDEGCFQSMDSLKTFNTAHEATNVKVFAFEEGGPISWLDILYSQREIWNAKDEIIVVRTSRECFIIATQQVLGGAVAPKTYRHPLSLLRTPEFKEHPLWSAGQQLLEICI